MKTKYLILVAEFKKKKDYSTKITEIEKKLTDHNHDKYITAPKFNTMAASVFSGRLAEANLITKTGFLANYQVLIEKLPQINHNTYLLKMS